MLLTEKRPLEEKICFNGRLFKIDMSFNNILTIFELIQDDMLTGSQKLMDTLYLFTGEEEFSVEYLTDEKQVYYAMELQQFIFNELLNAEENNEPEYLVDIAGNKFIPDKNEEAEEEQNVKSYDFIQDADYIFSAFWETYGINLYEYHDKMHWEEFIALFKGLSTDTQFMKIVDIRTRKLPTGKGTQKQRAELQRLKEKYRLK